MRGEGHWQPVRSTPTVSSSPQLLMVCKMLSIYESSTVDLGEVHFVPLPSVSPPIEYSQTGGLTHLSVCPEFLLPT